MANTLTALAPVFYSAAKEVAAEAVGALNSISMDFDSKGVAIGDVIKVPIAPVAAVGDYTPAMTTSAGTDKIASSTSVSIDYNKSVSWNLTGEQQRSLENGGSNTDWLSQLVKQGMRAIRNDAESKLCATIYQGASRAYGTAGTTPFATTIDDIANVYKILKDNGAPMADLQMVIDTNAGLNARKLSIIQQADQAGTDSERRTGQFLRQFGFQIKESAGIATHTKGTATGLDAIAAGVAVGATSIGLEGGDGGTLLAGDVMTFSNHSTVKYVSNSAPTAAATMTASIGLPGLRTALVDATEMTIGGNYTANLAFERNAIVGVMRPPLIPASPLINQMLITDEFGMTYLFCDIVGDGMRTFRLHAAYGFKVINPEFVVNLLG